MLAQALTELHEIASRKTSTEAESTAQHGKARQGDAVMNPRRWK